MRVVCFQFQLRLSVFNITQKWATLKMARALMAAEMCLYYNFGRRHNTPSLHHKITATVGNLQTRRPHHMDEKCVCLMDGTINQEFSKIDLCSFAVRIETYHFGRHEIAILVGQIAGIVRQLAGVMGNAELMAGHPLDMRSLGRIQRICKELRLFGMLGF